MFHATRPLVRWSSVDMRRANEYGCSYVSEMVTAKPRRFVTAAMAAMDGTGSLTGTWAA